LNMRNCSGDVSSTAISYFAKSGSSTLLVDYSRLGTTTQTQTDSTFAGGATLFFQTRFQSNFTVSSSGRFEAYFCRFVNTAASTAYTLGGSGAQIISNCYLITTASNSLISVGTDAIISTCTLSCPINPVITGAGNVAVGTLSYTNLGVGISTTGQVLVSQSNDSFVVVTPGAYPYTVLPQDGFIPVDSSAARTINLPASPRTGQKHTIKDNGGLAATNNITIVPAAGNIDGAASYVINVNYGSISIVYGGTQWSVI
jgi:hypothetical protein